MFHYVVAFFIFCVVLFLYLHIYFHRKTSDDLEIYELDGSPPSKDKLEEVCDNRQPVIFRLGDIGMPLLSTVDTTLLKSQYHAFDMKIRDNQDTLHIPLIYKKTRDLLDEDKEKRYFTERNDDFLSETGLVKQIRFHDAYLRPYLVSHCRYDFIQGSQNVTTPLRYEVNYRTFFFVTEGKLQIKLVPPKYTRFLHPIDDYDLFEFRSPVDVWDPSANSPYKQDYDKIKCLDIVLRPGDVLFLPAFWWYSIQFQEKGSTALVFHYKTYMNMLSLMPQYILYALQMQNIQRKTIPPINDISDDFLRKKEAKP